jgi:spore germination protein YaaH
MDFKTRVFFIAIAALCFFAIVSANEPQVGRANSNSAAALESIHSPVAPAPTAVAAQQPPTLTSSHTASAQEPVQIISSLPSAQPATTLPAPAVESSGFSGGSAVVPPPEPVIKDAPIADFAVTAWLQATDWSAGVESLKRNASLIKEVSPAWFTLNEKGQIAERAGAHVDDGALVETAHTNGIALRPLLMNVPGAGVSTQMLVSLLKDSQMRAKLAASLAALANAKGYDGFDLDLESLPVANLPELASLVEEVGAALHADGKTIAVSIDTQPSASVLPSWERIGKAADSVRIMAYGIPSKTPTAIVDVGWMQARLTHALKAIPKEKLSLGIPLYCNKWSNDARSSSTWAKLHTEKALPVSCSDAGQVKQELDIAKSLGVSSVALWRLGGEDPEIWNLLQPSR